MSSGPKIFVAFIVGFIFAVGLAVSGMTQPQKVLGFLDLAGSWDPTLMFVMLGALSVHFWPYRWIKNKPHPVYDDQWYVPTKSGINSRLIFGAAIFGVGWGLSGYCPGPAIVSAGSGSLSAVVLLVAMTTGMFLYDFYKH